jgi:hypothetical protein
VIDIVVTGGEGVDIVLELYDPNNVFITSSDNTFTGDDEEIIGADIEDDGDYTIVVRDYYDDGGSYTLTVTESDEAPGTADEEESDEGGAGNIENIFVFVDDGGEPLSSGINSLDAFVALLEDDYEVKTWVSSIDGPLEEEALEGTDLFIWDSGDYRDEEGLFDDDMIVIFNFLDSGAPFFITGSSPAFFAEVDLAPLTDLEIVGDDEILLAGFSSGDVILLDEVYETVAAEAIGEDLEEGDIPFFVRGPESDASGEVVGIATIDDFTEQRTALLLLPFVLLPEDVQVTLLENLIAWFGEG